MPVSGWRSVGVSVRVRDYPVLQARLRELGYRNLNQLVKDLINGKFTSKPINGEYLRNDLFSGKKSSPGEIRTPVGGSKGPHAWPDYTTGLSA